ncbi:hypothetical protein M3Y98_01019000 [Aphelenchoides besseyi]|nr:hypothetical protein M3Y98_01019000 [Aphelenchoides besseyi]
MSNTMTSGQRVLTIWILTLLVMVFLVVYLDGGLNGEPIVFFGLLWIIDLALLGMIVLRCARNYNVMGIAEESSVLGMELTRMSWGPAVYSSAIILSKFAFEIILCIQLRYQSLNIFWIVTPLWMFLGLVAARLCFVALKPPFNWRNRLLNPMEQDG